MRFFLHSREMHIAQIIDADGILGEALKSVLKIYILWAMQHKKN